ncbi:LysR family transcriptional regulator [Massilia sp. CCM 8734]|uniref:LysR family transcriptional regulator n=1 Tax=Massilia sp. CCM 8734 TaxID=2609283 RepID=UPI0014230E30|nr:LysR family transcriptional regulator [Massilia sp. CCM 8734]NHZ96320.1 LysR family transcriptional regulator [Massilia sp. CCM 8734]
MNKFVEMQLFVTVVDAGSMTEAARRLGTPKSVVSERLQQLERRLGIALLVRGRKMGITDPGQIFYAHCVRILAQVCEAEDAVLDAQASMRGQLRVAAPMAASVRYLGPMLAAFAARYPDLRMELDLSDRYVNMHDENYDVAIRMGNLQDSTLVARPITINRHLVCASPAYLAARGMPLHPDQLGEHDGLLYGNREPQGTWQLQVNGKVESFRIRNRLCTDSGHQLLEAAKAGLGLAILPTFLAADAIAANELRIVMPAFSPSGGVVSAIYRQSHRASPKIRTLVNFLAEQIGDPPVWEQQIRAELDAIGTERSENPNQ